MDKQQFDHIENSVRQASEDISIPFNVRAWEKMEVKLDNEFNKDRRRVAIWWWWLSTGMLLIVASGIYFYVHHSQSPAAEKSLSANASIKTITPHSSIDTKDRIKNINPANTPVIKEHSTSVNKLPAENSNSGSSSTLSNSTATGIRTGENLVKHSDAKKPLKAVTTKIPGTADQLNKNTFATSGHKINNQVEKSLLAKNQHKVTRKSGIATPENPSGPTILPPVKGSGTRSNNSSALSKDEDNHSSVVTNNTSGNQLIITDNKTIEAVATKDSSANIASTQPNMKVPVFTPDSVKSIDSVAKKSVAIKLNKPTPKGFYFTASLAADATGVKDLITTKNMKPVYGVGVGYRFNKRLSVQTGFYAGNRVYAAGPDDYYTNPGSYISKIISAEAECYIYDIPLSVRYDVLKQKNSNIYVISGLSSYILKREYYDMHFYNPMGAYHHMSYTYTHNTNFLSVVDFSVGFERKISDVLYIQAEPYLKVPIAGVGQGYVKLYSAGLQLGIKYQPFHKKK